MVRFAFTFTAAAMLVAAVGGRDSRAQDKAPAGKDKGGVNVASGKEPKPTPDKRATAVAQLATAYDLIQVGRDTKSPEALVLAAKLIAANPTTDGAKDEKVKSVSGGEAPKGGAVEAVDPAKLLDEAAKLSDRPYVAEMVKAARTEVAAGGRGEIDGPRVHNRYIGANGRATWTGVYVAGQFANITAAGTDGGVDLDMYVYDDQGNLIGSDTGPTCNASVSFTPRYTATFRIEVVNCSNRGTNYRYIHN